MSPYTDPKDNECKLEMRRIRGLNLTSVFNPTTVSFYIGRPNLVMCTTVSGQHLRSKH